MQTQMRTEANDPVSLEMTAALARSGFACMFSTSDEYERALIAARRAEGRYSQSSKLPTMLFIGCTIMLAGFWLIVI